jgi:tetrahydromethanopterin S-methyltransferase subunit F
MDSHVFGEVEMTTSEQKALWRGVAAGTIMGFALGLMIALFIAVRPELFRALIP